MNTSLSSTVPLGSPLYEQVKQAVLAALAQGEWKQGEAIPPEKNLAERFGVSIGTLRKAIDELAAENILVRHQGRVTYVAVHTRNHHFFKFFRILRQDGHKSYPATELLRFRRVKASAEARDKLGLPAGAYVFEFLNMLSLNGDVVMVDDICLPESRFPGMTMDDLARAAAAKPLAAGSSGNGTPPHLTLALYQKLTGAPLMHVPYKGGAPSLTDLIGGHLDVVFSNYPESLSHVKNGSLRALAITTRERSADLPDVPTVAQAGLPDLIVENFTGVMAPASTPPELVQRIGAAIVQQVSQPAMKQALLQLGFVPQPRGPAEFGGYLRSEVDRWAKIIRDANIQIA